METGGKEEGTAGGSQGREEGGGGDGRGDVAPGEGLLLMLLLLRRRLGSLAATSRRVPPRGHRRSRGLWAWTERAWASEAGPRESGSAALRVVCEK